jgi:hypothetical protein
MSSPSYFLWHPSIESRGRVVSVLLSRGACKKAPELGRKFFECLAAQCGVTVELSAWGVHEFISSYFLAPSVPVGHGGWEECWEVLLLVGNTTKASDLVELNAFPFTLHPERTFVRDEWIPLRVISNFGTKSQADRCVAELKRHALESADWPTGVYGYEIRHGPVLGRQLWVDVTSVKRDEIAPHLPKAEEVTALCERMGGIVRAPRSQG